MAILPLAFLSLSLLLSAESCAPGNQDDLDKIKFFTGLEVREKSLENTAYSEEYVESASDLNCDLETAGECKWKNAPTDNTFDNLNYYLFEKTENKLWDMTQLRPGSNPPLGNKLILAGSKEAGKTAVWISSPIKCQKNTGTLTFKYWLYNNPKVELHVFEAGSNPLVSILKPTQTCHSFVALGTECVISIPPIDKPFQLGIRAYGFLNLLGGLTMVDDIRYDADICTDPYNFGSAFVEEQLSGEVDGSDVETASDLDCTLFDECKWRNADDQTAIDWTRGSGTVDPDKWQEATGTTQTPDGPFSLVRLPENGDRAVLLSDLVPCQASDGSVSFRYWLAKQTQLRVCAVTVAQTPISCFNVQPSDSPGPVEMTIPGPIEQPFMLSFEATYLSTDANGGFAAIDDVEYSALLCTEVTTTTARPGPQSPTDLGPDFQTTPIDEGLTGAPITNDYEVDCDMTGELPCRWGNQMMNPRDAQWMTGTGEVDPFFFNELTGTSVLPDGEFAYIPFDSAGSGTLMTDPITCLKGDGLFTFSYWTTDAVKLRVCATQAEGNRRDIFCEDVDSSGSPGPGSVTLQGPIDEPFFIKIKAVAVGAGFAAVDDMMFSGDVCAESEISDNIDAEACRLLSCNFEDAMCGYQSPQVAGSVGSFKLMDGSVGPASNIRVGKDAGYFMGAILKSSQGKFAVLESPTFNIASEKVLKFNYNRGTYGSELYACKNQLDIDTNNAANPVGSSCKRVAGPALSLQEWRGQAEAPINLLPGDTKVYIIAVHTRFNYGPAAFLIDNLRVTDTAGAPIC